MWPELSRRLDFANSVLIGTSGININKLQRVQNCLARVILQDNYNSATCTSLSEPALGEGEQGPRPGLRACGGPAGHQRGAPHHAKTKRGGASARGTAHGSVSGVRLAHFGAPQCAGRRES